MRDPCARKRIPDGRKCAGTRVYLFWNTEDKCIGIPQGVTEVPGPAVNWQLRYTPEDVGKKEIMILSTELY